MKSNRGFTLIELMICVFIVLIVIAIATRGVAGLESNSQYTWGLNGMSETRCVSGYSFVISERGYTTQILDKDGKGVPCQ